MRFGSYSVFTNRGSNGPLFVIASVYLVVGTLNRPRFCVGASLAYAYTVTRAHAYTVTRANAHTVTTANALTVTFAKETKFLPPPSNFAVGRLLNFV